VALSVVRIIASVQLVGKMNCLVGNDELAVPTAWFTTLFRIPQVQVSSLGYIAGCPPEVSVPFLSPCRLSVTQNQKLADGVPPKPRSGFTFIKHLSSDQM
jgi:hypothetical protein